MKKTSESKRARTLSGRSIIRLSHMRSDEPSDEGAHASAGRSASVRAAKRAKQHEMRPTVRGAGSSGEARGTTLGARPRTRAAGARTSGTKKTGARRGARRTSAA
jgi:hypothetical protein